MKRRRRGGSRDAASEIISASHSDMPRCRTAWPRLPGRVSQSESWWSSTPACTCHSRRASMAVVLKVGFGPARVHLL